MTTREELQTISEQVSRRHPGCTFPSDEVLAVIEDEQESTGIPQADEEIRRAWADLRLGEAMGRIENTERAAGERLKKAVVEIVNEGDSQ